LCTIVFLFSKQLLFVPVGNPKQGKNIRESVSPFTACSPSRVPFRLLVESKGGVTMLATALQDKAHEISGVHSGVNKCVILGGSNLLWFLHTNMHEVTY
jgi:hypothetical protein